MPSNYINQQNDSNSNLLLQVKKFVVKKNVEAKWGSTDNASQTRFWMDEFFCLNIMDDGFSCFPLVELWYTIYVVSILNFEVG